MGAKLTDLTARTATAESDLIHVNSGDIDYKETKENFLGKIPRNVEFANDSTLVSQIDALSWGPYVGYIQATDQTKLSATGMPVQATYALTIYKYSAQNVIVHADALQGERSFIRRKSSGTWGSWIEPDEYTTISGTDAITLSSAQSSANIEDFTIAKSGQIVSVRAVIGNLNIASGSNTIGTIPAGYRPFASVSVDGHVGASTAVGTHVRVFINGTGNITVYASAASTNTTLRCLITYVAP